MPLRIRVARVGTSVSLNLILRHQMRMLSRDEFEICCVCDDDEWTRELREMGFNIWPLGMGRRPNPLRVLAWSVRFFRALRQRPVHIVHTHNAFHGIAGRVVARLAGVPIVTQTVHNWYYLEPSGSPRARFYRLLERWASKFCDVVFFVNQNDYRRALVENIVPEKKRCFIGNGIDIAAFARQCDSADPASLRTSLGLSEEHVVITMVGRLEPPKDHRMFLEGFARVRAAVPEARALLVGYGLQRASVEQQLQRLGLQEYVLLLGHRGDIGGVMKASDILVLTTQQEGFSRSLVEGMVAGLPIVATDVVGVREAVQHERTGLLVPYGDDPALAAALLRLIHDRPFAQRLARAGHDFAVEHFDERLPALRVGQAYRQLLAERGIAALDAGPSPVPG